MPMTFGPDLSNYTDLRYKVILDLEESGQEQPRAYKDGKGFATTESPSLRLSRIIHNFSRILHPISVDIICLESKSVDQRCCCRSISLRENRTNRESRTRAAV